MNQIQKEFHILTCGTSIITNAAKEKLFSFNPEAEELEQNREPVLKLLRGNPFGMSAELNASKGRILIKNGDNIEYNRRVERIYLIGTDTYQSHFCIGILKDFFRGVGAIVDSPLFIMRRGEEDNIEKVFTQGLLELTDRVASLIKNNRSKYKMCLNATGGFKPEVAFLTYIGDLLGCEIYYCYELFREVVTLPPFVNKNIIRLINEHSELFEHLLNNGNVSLFRKIPPSEKHEEKLATLEKAYLISLERKEGELIRIHLTHRGEFLLRFIKNIKEALGERA